MYGFHYKLALLKVYLHQMLGPGPHPPTPPSLLYGILTAVRASLRWGGSVCVWWKTSCDSHGWLSKSVIPKNEQRKKTSQGFIAELWPKQKLGPAYFLDTKGKTHGLPDSVLNRWPMKTGLCHSLSIMCDLLDLIFISSLLELNAELLSGALCLSLIRFFFSSFITQQTLSG